MSRLRSFVYSGQLGSVVLQNFDCVPCQLSKQSKLPFSNSSSRASSPFDLFHSDVWGSSPILTIGGSRYFVIFIDDYSRFTWIYVLKNRSELFSVYSTFANMIYTQFSRTIKIFKSVNAKEYTSDVFLHFLAQQGTITQTSCPGTSEQNGRAERKHRHIIETMGAMLRSASVPESLWGEAVLTAVYTINRIPSTVLGNLIIIFYVFLVVCVLFNSNRMKEIN